MLPKRRDQSSLFCQFAHLMKGFSVPQGYCVARRFDLPSVFFKDRHGLVREWRGRPKLELDFEVFPVRMRFGFAVKNRDRMLQPVLHFFYRDHPARVV